MQFILNSNADNYYGQVYQGEVVSTGQRSVCAVDHLVDLGSCGMPWCIERFGVVRQRTRAKNKSGGFECGQAGLDFERGPFQRPRCLSPNGKLGCRRSPERPCAAPPRTDITMPCCMEPFVYLIRSIGGEWRTHARSGFPTRDCLVDA